MGKSAKGWWDGRVNRYYARLGKISEKTGKPTPVMLCDVAGNPLAYGDQAGVAAAITRLLAARDAEQAKQAGPTVRELCAAFVRWHSDNGSAERTVDGHHYQLNRFCKFSAKGVKYGDRSASTIKPRDLWRIKKRNEALKAKGKQGWGALRNLYSSVLACWRWASRPIEGRKPTRMLRRNRLRGIMRPKPRGRVIEKLVDWRVARQVVRHAHAMSRQRPKFAPKRTIVQRRLKALCFALIVETGCRPFEAFGLRRDEIRWDDGILRIDPERTKPRGRDRRIAVSRRMLQALRVILQWESSHLIYVFVPRWAKFEGEPQTKEMDVWFREYVKPYVVDKGVPIPEEVTMYWFRHDWQTAGLEVETVEGVADAAGNSPQVLLSTYAHKKNKRVKEVAEKVREHRRKGVSGEGK